MERDPFGYILFIRNRVDKWKRGYDRSMKDHQGRVNWRWKGEEREKEVVYAKRRAVYPVFEAKVLRAT